MPFAHDAGLVACFLQHFRVGGLVAVEGGSTVVVQEPVVVGVAPCEHAGARRSAQGVGAVGAVKHHALIGQSAEPGQGYRTVLLAGAQRVCAVVIGDDKQDVRPLICTQRGAHAAHGSQSCENVS